MADGFLDALDAKYRVVLCDVWGVIHDGVRLYPGAGARLRQWRGEGRCIALLTNAPRTAEAVAQQLAALGLPRDAFDLIVTSGEAGIAALKALGRPVGFLGTPGDRAILAGRDVPLAEGADFMDIACMGLEEDRPFADDYRSDLEAWVAKGITLHCLNPDRVVIEGGVPVVCAGALADIYEAIGGRVAWYGKPFEPIYRHVLEQAGNPQIENVLAVGDGLQTDMLGAARMGIDAVFVSGGIHRGREFPDDFGAANGLRDWRPVAVAGELGQG